MIVSRPQHDSAPDHSFRPAAQPALALFQCTPLALACACVAGGVLLHAQPARLPTAQLPTAQLPTAAVSTAALPEESPSERYVVLRRGDDEAQQRFLAELGELRRARATIALPQRVAARAHELALQQQSLATWIGARGGRVLESFWLLDALAFEAPAGFPLDELRARSDVASVQAPQWHAPTLVQALNATHHQGYATHALQFQGAPITGGGETLAIIDTGLDLDMNGTGRPHAAFYPNGDSTNLTGGGIAGSRVLAATKHNSQFSSVTTNDDTYGHGTRMGAIAAGAKYNALPSVGSGAAPATWIRSYKIGSDTPPMYYGLADGVAMMGAFQAAVAAPDVYVANMSYGGVNDPTYYMNPTMDAAVAAGVTVTLSAGNNGANLGNAHPTYNPIVVGGSEEFMKAPATSTYLTAVGPLADGRRYPTMLAQGVALTTALKDNEASTIDSNGSSGAAALVAGSAILMHQVAPQRTPVEIKAVLLNTTATAGGNQNATGWGYLLIKPAVESLLAGEVVREPIQQGMVRKYHVALSGSQRITLVWERIGTSMSYSASQGLIANLDLRVVDPASGATLLSSASTVDNVEQLDLSVLPSGNYEVHVVCVSGPINNQQTPFALAGVSTFSFDDGLGCPGGAPILQSTTPASAPAISLAPTIVTLHGCNLTGTTQVRVNGIATPFTLQSPKDLAVTLPDLVLPGPAQIEVVHPAGNASLSLPLTAPAPLLKFGTPAGTVVFPVDVLKPATIAGPPGYMSFVALSGANSPSQLPGIIDLAIGNGFNELYVLTAKLIPAAGSYQQSYVFHAGLPFGTAVYWQAAMIDAATLAFPLVATNVVNGIVL
jgi:hypothetical protein